MSKLKYPLLALASFICAALTGIAYEGYNRSAKLYKALSSHEPSKFELAANKLGFSSMDEQEALLTIFYLAGYFKSEKLWQDLAHFDKHGYPIGVFTSMERVMAKAGANQDDYTKFDAKILRKGLFANVEIYDSQDIKDWLLYVAQNAFNRKAGVERYELADEDWMVEYKDEYIKHAQKLGLIDKIAPASKKYDQVWIAGASHDALSARIAYYYEQLKAIKDLVQGDNVLALAGQRPLWAQIDGGEYIKGLAERSDIELNSKKPFIKYGQKDEDGKEDPEIEYKDIEDLPKGYVAGRSYPNYTDLDRKKLTESLMAEDLLKGQLGVRTRSQPASDINSSKVIDTKLAGTGDRPNTSTTARDATERLIQEIQAKKEQGSEQKDFSILFITNNPYIERQTIATKREVNKSLANSGLDQQGYSLKIEGVGSKSERDVTVIHSELAALVAEKYKDSPSEAAAGEFRHEIKELLFQTRGHDRPVDEFSGTSCMEYLVGKCQDFFEYCYWH